MYVIEQKDLSTKDRLYNTIRAKSVKIQVKCFTE